MTTPPPSEPLPPVPPVSVDAVGRISYTIFRDTLVVDPNDPEELIEKLAEFPVTLPTPLPATWAAIPPASDNLRCSVVEVALGPNAAFRWSGGSWSSDIKYCSYTSKCWHPALAPVPWRPEYVFDGVDAAKDLDEDILPEGVTDRCATDPVWFRMANELHALSFDEVPHWTVEFASQEIAQRRAFEPLPTFGSDLLADPEISDLIFVFDATRIKAPRSEREAVNYIMLRLAVGYARMLEARLSSSEPAAKRRKLA